MQWTGTRRHKRVPPSSVRLGRARSGLLLRGGQAGGVSHRPTSWAHWPRAAGGPPSGGPGVCSHWPCACMAGARGRLVRCGLERPSRRCAPAPGRADATVHVCTRCGDDPPEAERPGSSQFLACGGAVCAGPALAAVCVPTRCARAPVPAREPRLRGTWCLCRSRVRVAALGGPGCHCRSRVRRSRVRRGRGGARPHSLRRWSLSAEAGSMSLQRCLCTLAA